MIRHYEDALAFFLLPLFGADGQIFLSRGNCHSTAEAQEAEYGTHSALACFPKLIASPLHALI